jgi:hypothetical protein
MEQQGLYKPPKAASWKPHSNTTNQHISTHPNAPLRASAHTLSLSSSTSSSLFPAFLGLHTWHTWLSSSSAGSQWRWRHRSCRRRWPGALGSRGTSTRSRRTTTTTRRQQPWSRQGSCLSAMRAAACRSSSSSTPLCTAPTSWPATSPPWPRPSASRSRSKPKFVRT